MNNINKNINVEISKLRELIMQGYTYQEICRKMGCNLAYINNLRKIAIQQGKWPSDEEISKYSKIREERTAEEKRKLEEKKEIEKQREEQEREQKKKNKEKRGKNKNN